MRGINQRQFNDMQDFANWLIAYSLPLFDIKFTKENVVPKGKGHIKGIIFEQIWGKILILLDESDINQRGFSLEDCMIIIRQHFDPGYSHPGYRHSGY